jgi:hypothetical protein
MTRLKLSSPIDFIVEARSISMQKTGKPVVPVSSKEDGRKFVSSKDLYAIREYDIASVKSLTALHPVILNEKIKCPACMKTVDNTEPSYLLPPCPSGCKMHPSRWIIEKRSPCDLVDALLVIENDLIGKQVVHGYIDREFIPFNSNVVKLASARNGIGTSSITAMPILVFEDVGKFSLALWIASVSLKMTKVIPDEKELVFKVDAIPTSEKDFVMSAFFSNLEFMKFYLSFDKFRVQKGFPDLIIREHDGTKRVIEFELESRNFDRHEGHDPAVVDYIICWTDNRKKIDDVKIISLDEMQGKKITFQ